MEPDSSGIGLCGWLLTLLSLLLVLVTVPFSLFVCFKVQPGVTKRILCLTQNVLLNSSQLPRITFEVYYRDPDSFYCMGEGAGWCCFVFYDDGICECEFVNELIFLLFFCDEPVNSELIRGLSGKEGLFFRFSVSKILNNEQANLRCIGVLTSQNEFKLSYNF